MPPKDKHQLHCYLEKPIGAEIDDYVQRNGQTRGRLVETMWSMFIFKDLSLLVERLSAHLSHGIPANALVPLRRLKTVIDNALNERTEP